MDNNFYGSNNFDYVPTGDGKKNIATTILVLSIASFFCCGPVCSIIAMVLYFVNKNSFNAETGKTAKTGFILAIVAFVLSIIGMITSFTLCGFDAVLYSMM